MPYVDEQTKIKLRFRDNQFPTTAGELTYLIYRLAHQFLRFKGKCFTTCCLIMGSFICAAFEFYRRVIAKYEDKKIKENGDVN